MFFSMVFVITLKPFNFHIFVKRSINISTTFHIKLEICHVMPTHQCLRWTSLHIIFKCWPNSTVKWLLPCRFVVHIDALNVVHMVTLKQLLYSPLHNSPLDQQKRSWKLNLMKTCLKTVGRSIPSFYPLASHIGLCWVLAHHVAWRNHMYPSQKIWSVPLLQHWYHYIEAYRINSAGPMECFL